MNSAALGQHSSKTDRLIAPLATEAEMISEACFAGLDDQTNLLFERVNSDSKELLKVKLSELGWWGGATDRIEQPIVLLSDGSMLVGYVRAFDSELVTISSLVWQDVKVNRSEIRGVLFYLPENRAQQQLWLARLKDPTLSVGRVWTRRGDSIDGQIKAIGDNFVTLDVRERETRLARSRIALVKFAGPADESAPINSLIEVCFTDGTQLRTSSIRFSNEQAIVRFPLIESGSLQLTLRDEVQTKNTAALSMVCGLRSLQNETSFLSDRNPDRYQHQPLVGNEIKFFNNRSLSGEQLTLTFPETSQRVQMPFGVTVPSRSSLIYQLSADARALQFGVAMQPNHGGVSGNVTCKVLGLDGTKQWQTLWTRDVTAAKPEFAQLSLKGISAIALAVDYGLDADVGDRINWLMPRVLR